VYLDWRPIVFAAGVFAVHHVLFDRLQAAGYGFCCLSQPDFAVIVLHAVYVVIQTALEVVFAVSVKAALARMDAAVSAVRGSTNSIETACTESPRATRT
jgi:hypothetical protein